MQGNHVHFNNAAKKTNRSGIFSKSFHFRPFHPRYPLSSILENKFDSSMFALYVRQKKTTFEIQILPTVKFGSRIPISLLSLKNCMGSCDKYYWRGKFPYVRFVNVPTWFFCNDLFKAFFLPLALNFSPDIDTVCHTTLEIVFTNSCWKKLIWIRFNQIKHSVSILNQTPQVEGCSSNRLSRTRASSPKNNFLHVNKSNALYKF